MKLKTTLILILFTSFGLQAQDKLQFIMEDWDQALATAKTNNKYIVVDAYTEWCGWCKVMDKKTFTHAGVIAYYSENFVPVKIDMEKGIGIDLAMKYRVSAFPSTLYFTPDGVLVYRTIGYRDTTAFINDGKEALDPGKQFRHPGDPLLLDPGFPQFYKDSFKKGKERKWPEQGVVDEFLASQTDYFSEVSWSVMSRFNLNNTMTSQFLNNKAMYEKLYGQIEVDDKFTDLIYSRVQSSIKNNKPNEFEEAMRILRGFGNPEDTASTAAAFRMYYYKEMGNWKTYSSVALRLVNQPDVSNSTKNDYAWTIYENVDDQPTLNAARDWMRKVVDEEPEYAYIDTYAALLYKLGQYKEAEKQIIRAIEVGTESKNNVEGSQELLEKIRKARE